MKSKKSPIKKNIDIMDNKKEKFKSPKKSYVPVTGKKEKFKSPKKAYVPVAAKSKMFKGKVNYSVTKVRSPKIKKVKSELSDLQMSSFIDCIHFIKTNIDTYDDGDKLICDIYFIIEPRININIEHPLINTEKLYENVIDYAKTYWSSDNIKLMKQLISNHKTHKYYTFVKNFLNEL
jgi:hypothetical protein